MIDAEKFLEESAKQPVYNYIYCYYDKDLDRYNTPYITHEQPELMAEQARGAVLKDPKNQFKFAGLILTYLGKFNIKSGLFELEPEIVALADMDKFIKKEVQETDA